MPSGIDYDKGVIKRRIDKLGINVYMYVNEPGVYRNTFGDEVDEKLAKQAGFDVEALGKDRVKRQRMAEAMQAIEDELATDAKVEKVKERDGYTLVHIGLGRHQVRDPEGGVLNPVPVPKEEGLILFDAIVPAKKRGPAKPKEEAEEKDES